MSDFTFIDLFAGIGGFRLALESIGGKCLGFSEIAKDAVETYCANFKESEKDNLGDITKLAGLPAHDFMTAGVPCQSWSIAGKNLGFDDDRGQLWNDTLFLLNKARPKAFIFENVKGLADPRNRNALDYIMRRIREAGYHARFHLINASDYGVPQTRVRIYIVGFREELYAKRFVLPKPNPSAVQLSDVLDGVAGKSRAVSKKTAQRSLSCNAQGFNDYFLFNDLRDGETTIHSWDIKKTSEKEKRICKFLLKNRRKSLYGPLDGNPLSLEHFRAADSSVSESDLEGLVKKEILKNVPYLFKVEPNEAELSESESFVLSLAKDGTLNRDIVKNERELKKRKIDAIETLSALEAKGALKCTERRYDFKNSKISTGLDGVNRIFLPSSKIYPTLVASDTNDFVTPVQIDAPTIAEFRKKFMADVFVPKKFRKITRSESCRIQGFPDTFILPESRPRWMHLIGNSVAVPVVRTLAKAVAETGVFGGEYVQRESPLSDSSVREPDLFSEFGDVAYA